MVDRPWRGAAAGDRSPSNEHRQQAGETAGDLRRFTPRQALPGTEPQHHGQQEGDQAQEGDCQGGEMGSERPHQVAGPGAG